MDNSSLYELNSPPVESFIMTARAIGVTNSSIFSIFSDQLVDAIIVSAKHEPKQGNHILSSYWELS